MCFEQKAALYNMYYHIMQQSIWKYLDVNQAETMEMSKIIENRGHALGDK